MHHVDAGRGVLELPELPTFVLNDALRRRGGQRARRPAARVRLSAIQPQQLLRPRRGPAPRRAVRPRVQRIGNLDEPALGPPAQVRSAVAAHRAAQPDARRSDRRRQPGDARRGGGARRRRAAGARRIRTASIPIATARTSTDARVRDALRPGRMRRDRLHRHVRTLARRRGARARVRASCSHDDPDVAPRASAC